jgi:regulator of protease activity HflC (stomatin/prohibitin superfamily)
MTQLARTSCGMSSVIGGRELDAFLIGNDTVGQEIEQAVRRRPGELGLEIASVGIRDVILAGEMKDLMNKVPGWFMFPLFAAALACAWLLSR